MTAKTTLQRRSRRQPTPTSRSTAGAGVGVGAGAVAAGAAPPRLLTALTVAVGVLAAATAVVGLAWQGTGDIVTTTTVRGGTIELLGRGLYRFDTLFGAANNWAGNLVMLLFGLPLLVVATHLRRRGSAVGDLLLVGTLGFFLYMGASYALGAMAYNELFFVHVLLLSASLYAFVLAFSADVASARIPTRTRRPWIGAFMVASGVGTLVIWATDPVTALLTGGAPAGLGAHTTLFTHAFDIAVIVPAAVAAGVAILRGHPLGYRMAAGLLVLEVLLLPTIVIATALQLDLGVTFSTAEVVGPITGFGAMATAAAAVLVALLRTVAVKPKGGTP